MDRLRKTPLAAVIALLVHGQVLANDSRVPEGFEELSRGQTLWLEVMLYGNSLGLFQANVDLDNVQFLQPEEVAAAVGKQVSIPTAQTPTFTARLGTSLQRNGHLSCSSNGRASGCDFITTDSLALIYDENNARVALFLSPELQPQQGQREKYHQVTAKSRNGLVHQQNLNVVASDAYKSASIQGNGALGVTENSFLNVDWNAQTQQYRSASRQQTDVSNAYFRYDLAKNHYVQGGIMDSRDIFNNMGGNINLSQLPLGRIHGVRAGSTQAWLNQETSASGTPLPVFLTQDARVDAYRGSQLLGSFYLNPGTHELNTRNFPAGSYSVTLQIFENNQLARTETLPYTHVGNTEFDQFQWFAQAGELDNKYQATDDSNRKVLQGGMRIPLKPNLSLTTGSTLLSDVQYVESALDWRHGFNTGPIDGVLNSRFSYLYGSDGSSGNNQQLSYNDGFSLSFFRSERSAPDCNSQAQKRYSYSGCYKSTTVMLSVPVSSWRANLSYALNSNEGRSVYRNQLLESDPAYHTGAPWEQIFTTRSRSQTWQSGVSRNFAFQGININTSLNAFTRKDSGFNHKDYGGFATVNVSRSTNASGSATHSHTSFGTNGQTRRHGGDQLGYNASYSRSTSEGDEREIGAAMSGLNTDTITASAWGSGSGQYGNASLNLTNSWESQNNSHTLTTSGSYASSLVLDRSGITLGRWGDGTPSSAVTVALETQEETLSSPVDMTLDSGGHTKIGASGKGMLTVPGYRATTLNVTESAAATSGASSALSKGSGAQPLFMPPGRVLRHEVEVASRYTWLGSLTDEQQRPLDGAIPLNAASWSPFSAGGFMMETARPVKTLYVMHDQRFWQCPLTVQTTRDVVRNVGTSQCHPLDLSALPDAERKQAQPLANQTPGALPDSETPS